MIHTDINNKAIYIFQIMKSSDLQIYEIKKINTLILFDKEVVYN